MKPWVKVAAVAAGVTLFGAAEAGHESPVYPSFYPQEIRIEVVEPGEAGRALAESRIQAYLGALAEPPAGAKEALRSVETLGAYVVVRTNAISGRAATPEGRCALARQAFSILAAKEQDGFRFHPYPVNPLHADYLHHFDLAARAIESANKPAETPVGDIRLRAAGALAERLTGAQPMAEGGEWDARVETIDLGELLKPHRFGLNGWAGPPWLKQGWFHAYLLLAADLAEEQERARAGELVAALQRGGFAANVDGINLERELLGLLTGGCRGVVAGYMLRRWHFNADYSAGVENIAFDSHAGFRSAIFLRTVKLKDFPWNGWLALGVPEAPAAAWNPFGGFGDETGRVLWLALGDPALFPEPYNAAWSLNRIGDVKKAAP